MKYGFCTLLLSISLLLPAMAFGQFETGVAYTHQTGNNGVDGFSAELGWLFARRVTLVAQGDFLWDTSRVGVFDLSSNVGAVSIKSNMQQYLGGGRVNLVGFSKHLSGLEKRKVIPFAEIFFGLSRLSQKVTDTQGVVSVDASDKAFTWVIGGGVDYRLSPHWMARGNLDLVRNHFVDAGQTNLRFGIGLAHIF